MANAPAIKGYRFLACITLLVLIGAYFHVKKDSVYARSPLTCPSTSCPIARVEGFQPVRYETRSTFNNAASNNLGSNGPTYKLISHGLPPNVTQESITTSRPIPHIILRGVAWQESHWLQFANSVSDPDNLTACTLISSDCGYGVTQVTSCMDTNGCGWFTPSRVSGELAYNIGTGTNFLIEKWNGVNFIGENDHTLSEEWYYAVTAYNGWDPSNDPNQFDPARPPYGEANYTNYGYPYQEKIWGIMAHPEIANLGAHQLWRNSRVTAVPRGVFGLGSGWQPPNTTTNPISHLLNGIQISNGLGPSLTLQNSTANTLALDIMLYNDDGTFNRRWLGSPDPPYPPSFSPFRLSPNQTLTLSLASAFRSWESPFTGYARIDASEGISIALSYPNKIYLPITIKSDLENCYNEVWNGGFEEIVDGSPNYWTTISSDGYKLADSTWFKSGHKGAYLGGYDNANDTIRQPIYLPDNATSLLLTYSWFMQTFESLPYEYDFLYIRLRDTNGILVSDLGILSNRSVENIWQTASVNLLYYAGRSLRLSLETTSDSSKPTSFFLDDMSIWVCTP